MAKLIKAILAVLIVWAAWHIGVSYYHFYTFEDAVQEMAQLGGNQSEDQIGMQAAKLADDNGVPLKVEDIGVRKDAGQVVVEAAYKDPVEVLPRYRYPIPHRLHVRVYVLAGLPTNRR